MKCNLIPQTNEITIRQYTLIEDEGITSLVSSRPMLSMKYEDDEENPGRHMIVIAGSSLQALMGFLSFVELPWKLIQ